MQKLLRISCVLTFLCIASCQNSLKELHFEVIDDKSLIIKERPVDPFPIVIIISKADEITSPSGLEFLVSTREYLQGIDYDHHFAVLLLRNQIHESGSVQEIIRSGNTVVIRTNALEIGPGNYALRNFTPPYQLIQITKEGDWGEEIQFIVEREEQGIVEKKSHLIP